MCGHFPGHIFDPRCTAINAATRFFKFLKKPGSKTEEPKMCGHFPGHIFDPRCTAVNAATHFLNFLKILDRRPALTAVHRGSKMSPGKCPHIFVDRRCARESARTSSVLRSSIQAFLKNFKKDKVGCSCRWPGRNRGVIVECVFDLSLFWPKLCSLTAR